MSDSSASDRARVTGRVLMIFGTRPEAIKMGPVYQAMIRHPSLEPLVLLTGQHLEQLEQAIGLFDIPTLSNLRVMTENQPLPETAGTIVEGTASRLREVGPDYVLVHGDTLSTFAASWTAFLLQIPVGHVEAGLRTHDLGNPFPEEANRHLTDTICDLHLAPTGLARNNLLAEGIPAERIIVTGQTGVDAILHASRRGALPENLPEGPFVTVTMHRRENWPVLGEMARALATVARRHPDRTFVFPVHLNPNVREAVTPVLSSVPNFILLPPLEYGEMAALLRRSELVVTDSGGLQEEGAALGLPVVVLREETERPEGVAAGILRIAGTDPDSIRAIVDELLSSPEALREMADSPNPYGDGRAGARVAEAVVWRLGHGTRPEDWAEPALVGTEGAAR